MCEELGEVTVLPSKPQITRHQHQKNKTKQKKKKEKKNARVAFYTEGRDASLETDALKSSVVHTKCSQLLLTDTFFILFSFASPVEQRHMALGKKRSCISPMFTVCN